MSDHLSCEDYLDLSYLVLYKTRAFRLRIALNGFILPSSIWCKFTGRMESAFSWSYKHYPLGTNMEYKADNLVIKSTKGTYHL